MCCTGAASLAVFFIGASFAAARCTPWLCAKQPFISLRWWGPNATDELHPLTPRAEGSALRPGPTKVCRFHYNREWHSGGSSDVRSCLAYVSGREASRGCPVSAKQRCVCRRSHCNSLDVQVACITDIRTSSQIPVSTDGDANS